MNVIYQEEYRCFKCFRYKILTNITYGYDENETLIYANCSLQDEKHCRGYESPDRKCPYRYPRALKDIQ